MHFYVRRVFIFLCLLGCTPFAFAQDKIEVITLNYRAAEQVIPIIQPLLDKDGAVTGMQNRLIIRTSPANLAQIKCVLAQIDTQPKRLMITVRQSTTRDALARESSVYGTVGGEGGRMTLPQTPGAADARVEVGGERNRAGAKITSTRDIENSADVQKVQVLEGNPAFIRVGQSVPYRGRTVYRDARGTTVVDDTQFKDVTSGFYVLPRVSGDRVILEINPQRDTLGSHGAVNIQQAATTLSGRLGEWIELGGIGQQADTSGSGTVYSTRDASTDNRSIFVKVEEVR
ncbi:MAG: secretin N-terminal domain-containing protein [Burkholderiales bacterium]